MNRIIPISFLLISCVFILGNSCFARSMKPASPQVEVVFVLDTTGSMSGLIQAAKDKIWYLATQIQNADPVPDVKFGLIGYRDRGDAYVTKQYDLTEDIHDIYAKLLQFEADGGGDTPESVNQALFEAINQMSWSEKDNVLRVVFLVGDAPPAMTYKDDIPYSTSVKKALEKDIIINAVLCGNAEDTKEIWQSIAKQAHGDFMKIPQNGNVTVIETPYDEEIKNYNVQLGKTVITYGDDAQRKQVEGKLSNSYSPSVSGAISSDVASFNRNRKSELQVVTGQGDLINDLDRNVVEFDKIDKKQLPAPLQNLNDEALKRKIEQAKQQRVEIQEQLDALAFKREAYVQKKQHEFSKDDKDAFDLKSIEVIKAQGSKKNINYHD